MGLVYLMLCDQVDLNSITRSWEGLTRLACNYIQCIHRKADDNLEEASDKPTVKALSIPRSEMLKWSAIHEEAKSVLLKSISSSSRYRTQWYSSWISVSLVTFCSLIRMNEHKRKMFEEQMEAVITKLKSDLDSATAPRVGRLKSYTNLDSRIVSLVFVFGSWEYRIHVIWLVNYINHSSIAHAQWVYCWYIGSHTWMRPDLTVM